MTTSSASVFFQNLDPDAKARYISKISIINGLDPFSAELVLGNPIDSVPPLDASDLVSYLVLQTNFITSKQFKAHKSLEAYNQFVSGWVKDVQAWKIDCHYLIKGRVSF